MNKIFRSLFFIIYMYIYYFKNLSAVSASSIEASLAQSLTFSKSFRLFSTVVSLLVVPFGRLLCHFGDLGGIILGVISG